MARFKTILTNSGSSMLTQALASGNMINLDRTIMGDGIFTGEKIQVENIVSPINVNSKISDREFIRGDPSLLKISIQTMNDGLTSPVAIREIGLFAGDTLFAYAWIEGKDTDNVLPPPLDINVADTIHGHELVLFTTNQENARITVQFAFDSFVSHRYFQDTIDELSQSIIVISDTEPTQPCQIWLKPHGGMIGNHTGSGTTLNISGAHVGDSPPTDTSNMWFETIEA